METRESSTGWKTTLVIAIVVVIVAGVAVPLVIQAQRRNRVEACAHNLLQMWKTQNIYRGGFGGRMKTMPVSTGRDFWLNIQRGKLIEGYDICNCPVLNNPKPECQYRGPGTIVHTIRDEAPVGADDMDNHGGQGGNVLRKSGDVTEFPAQADFAAITRDLK